MRIQVRTYRPTVSAAPSAATYSLFPVPYSLLPITYLTAAFSAKERDVETGLSVTSLRSVSSLPLGNLRTSSHCSRRLRRFGARYYSSDLSIWLAVDPMVDKYPSFSPYTYCANNPVKLVDPEGEDYEVVIEGNTITIKATYYITKDAKKEMKEAIKMWNNTIFAYKLNDGKKYNLKFDLSIAGEFDTFEEAYQKCNEAKNNDDFSANLCFKGTTSIADNGLPAIGETQAGNVIIINENKEVSSRTYAHEIGHTLGIGEWSSGLMESGGTGATIHRRHMQQSLNRVGLSSSPNTMSMYNNPTKTKWSQIGNGKVKSTFTIPSFVKSWLRNLY